MLNPRYMCVAMCLVKYPDDKQNHLVNHVRVTGVVVERNPSSPDKRAANDDTDQDG